MKKTVMAIFGLSFTATAVFAQEVGDHLGIVESEEATFQMTVVANGFELPMGLAFLPDGKALVADRFAGELFVIDIENGSKSIIEGVSDFVSAPGEFETILSGSLMDVYIHPDYASNGWIYVSYGGQRGDGWTTVIDRIRIEGNRVAEHEELFVAYPSYEIGDHFGSRIQIKDGYLFFSVGDRLQRDYAQDLSRHNGKIIRLHEDGSIPKDNPFVGQDGVLPEIWSYGHRNPQGLVFHPDTGVLWESEHGPRGGDEVNIIAPGKNYGWVTYTYGEEYAGGPVGEGLTHGPSIEQPVFYYKPSIAPSGMEFYTGDAFPGWQGNIFIGALALTHLNRLVIEDSRVINEEWLLEERGWRIRFATQGADDNLYIGIDEGLIIRLSPVEQPVEE